MRAHKIRLISHVNPKNHQQQVLRRHRTKKFRGLLALPSKKKRFIRPWWHSPSVSQIIATTKAIENCNIPPLIIQHIFSVMAQVKYPTRPSRARKKWLEPLVVDGTRVYLSCHVEGDKIVVTHIGLPKGGFETKSEK